MTNRDKIVFSTKTGDQRKKNSAASGPKSSLPPSQQDLRIMRDKKGRKGKMVTVVSGFKLTKANLNDLAKTLKAFCGSGGTVKIDGNIQVIEIQGDQRDRIAEKLRALGYKVKLAGG